MDSFGVKTGVSFDDISSLYLEWRDWADICVSVLPISQFDHGKSQEPSLDKYAGGSEGRMIAIYQPPFGTQHMNRSVSLYDHKFNQISRILVHEKCDDLFIYVDKRDRLIVITDIGKVLTFSNSHLDSTVDLGITGRILKDVMFENCVVFVDSSFNCYLARDYKNPKRFATLPTMENLSQFVAIPPSHSQNAFPIVFASEFDRPVFYAASADGVVTYNLPQPAMFMSLSPDYQFLTLVLRDNIFVIMDSSLEVTHCIFPLSDDSPVFGVSWLGSATPIVIYSGHFNVVFHDQTDNVEYVAEKPVVFPTANGALVLTSDSLVEYSIVDSKFQTALKAPNPTTLFSEDTVTKDDIKSYITCAKRLNRDVPKQKTMLLAANLALSYLPDPALSQKIATVIKYLRVNNQAFEQLGMYMNYKETVRSTLDGSFFQRVCNRNAHGLALEMAKYLHIDHRPVLTDWFKCVLIAGTKPADAIKLLKLRAETEEFDFAAVAAVARSFGLEDKSLEIARMCALPAMSVRFFIQCGMYDDAIDACVRAGDTQLLLEVLKECDIEKVKEAAKDSALTYGSLAKLVHGDIQHPFSPAVNQDAALNQQSIEIDIHNRLSELPEGINTTMSSHFVALVEKYEKIVPKNSSLQAIVELAKHRVKTEKLIDKLQNIPSNPKSFNAALEAAILANDVESIIPMLDTANYNHNRFRLLVGQVYAKNGKWTKLCECATSAYKAHWETFVILCINAGEFDYAREFIRRIPDQSTAAALEEKLNLEKYPVSAMGESVSSYSVFPRGLFK